MVVLIRSEKALSFEALVPDVQLFGARGLTPAKNPSIRNVFEVSKVAAEKAKQSSSKGLR